MGANRKAESVGAAGRITAEDLFQVFQDSEGVCAYCGIDIDPMFNSFDHVKPFKAGGHNVTSNLKACCLSCQRSKFTKSPEEFEEWRHLERTCEVCGRKFKPRWSDYVRGYGRTCTRVCSGSIGGASPRSPRV